MKNKILNIILLFLIVLTITSCKDNNNPNEPDTNNNNSTENNEPSIVPTFGETLKVSIRNPVTLNPLLNEDLGVDQVLKLVFEPLFKIDNQYKPVPNLVESYNISSDNLSITLTLNDNLLFNNNEPLTAYDVKHSIEVLQKAKETVIYKSCVNNIQRVSVLDNQNMKIYFKQPFAFATYVLNFPIVSRNSSDIPIGSGLYEIESFTTMQDLKLVAANQHKDKLYIERVEATITREADVDTNAFKQNLIDLLSPSKFDWFEHSDASNQKTKIYTTNYFEFLGFNFKNFNLSNPLVRQAIAYGINREEIARKQFLSQVVVTEYPIHPNSWLSPAENELTYSYDTKQAKELLNGIDLNNFTLKLLVNSENSSRVKVAKMIQDNLKSIEIDVEIIAVEKETFDSKLQSGDFDLVLSGWKLSVVPDYTDMFHSSRIGTGSNFINYNNEEMDTALKNVYNSLDDAKLYANFQEFNKLYERELPYLSLYFMNSLVLTNKGVYGELDPITDNVFNGIQNLYISR